MEMIIKRTMVNEYLSEFNDFPKRKDHPLKAMELIHL